MRLSPEHVREKMHSVRQTEISGEKERVRISTLDIGVVDHSCRVSVGGWGEKPSAWGEEPVTIVVPRVQDFLLQTGDTTVGVPDNTQTNTRTRAHTRTDAHTH